ncbi:MAG: hypothetical protein SF097_18340 [Acidobacteriota bacterium]|nr:hypothetical protein [Acidobacteriota bacterium]
MKLIHSFSKFAFQFLCLLAVSAYSIQAQSPADTTTQKSENTVERIEFEFERAPLLEVELTKYLTSDVRKARTFELTATLLEPLRTESGLVIIPAQTKLRLKANVRPGSYFGHPGEVVMWLDPFTIGKGIEGFACEPATESMTGNGAASSGGMSGSGKLHPLICQNTWRMAFDHQLDHAATPEAGRPLVLERKRRHEGISGTRSSRPPNLFYDPSSGNVDQRLQVAANRFQMAGIVYELSAAVTGVVRFLFSKRNVFLPTGTRVVFQLEQKLRLVPATDAPVRILPVKSDG